MSEIPQGKLQRSAIGSKTAVQVGGKLLGYYCKASISFQLKKGSGQKADGKKRAQLLFLMH